MITIGLLAFIFIGLLIVLLPKNFRNEILKRLLGYAMIGVFILIALGTMFKNAF